MIEAATAKALVVAGGSNCLRQALGMNRRVAAKTMRLVRRRVRTAGTVKNPDCLSFSPNLLCGAWKLGSQNFGTWSELGTRAF